jgi:hypothetical protein
MKLRQLLRNLVQLPVATVVLQFSSLGKQDKNGMGPKGYVRMFAPTCHTSIAAAFLNHPLILGVCSLVGGLVGKFGRQCPQLLEKTPTSASYFPPRRMFVTAIEAGSTALLSHTLASRFSLLLCGDGKAMPAGTACFDDDMF